MDTFIREYQNDPVKAQNIKQVTDFNTYLKKGLSDFKIFHTNIRSISKNIDELFIYLNQLRYNCIDRNF